MSENGPKLLHFTYDVTHKKSTTPYQKFFYECRLEDCRCIWALEQLSSAISRGAIALVRQPKTAGFRLKSRYEYIVRWLSKW